MGCHHWSRAEQVRYALTTPYPPVPVLASEDAAAGSQQYPLRLGSAKLVAFCHSQHRNIASLRRLASDPVLDMPPAERSLICVGTGRRSPRATGRKSPRPGSSPSLQTKELSPRAQKKPEPLNLKTKAVSAAARFRLPPARRPNSLRTRWAMGPCGPRDWRHQVRQRR
jgi:hypothetical protein